MALSSLPLANSAPIIAPIPDPIPCPFCRSTLVAHGQFDGHMSVNCLGCFAHGPSTARPVPEIGEIRPWIIEAYELWNRAGHAPAR